MQLPLSRQEGIARTPRSYSFSFYGKVLEAFMIFDDKNEYGIFCTKEKNNDT